jgi:Glycosyl transferase family group 2
MRPPVSVVMPFAGDGDAARTAAAGLLEIATEPGDQLILSDNSGTAPLLLGLTVVDAGGERSPAHARNAGARLATADWILFLDADCIAPPNLIEAYFAEPIGDRVGALAGEVVPAGGGSTLAARYGSARGFLSQQQHLAHPYLPRAVAANLLVRRSAFEQVGGFYEGLRAAEDTDFTWRLQQAGWRLEPRPAARVEHLYRATLGELRRQWRGYAAGRAWLARRYEGFEPQPAVTRALRRARGSAPPRQLASSGRLERGRFLALDALLAAEELAGLALSNRPAPEQDGQRSTRVVLVADRFPTPGDPLVDLARTLGGARVEASARPDVVAPDPLTINYREDDGAALRAWALAGLVLRHPLRCLFDAIRRGPGEPSLSALAPAVRRLERDPQARVHALGRDHAHAVARRLARLAGRPLQD